MAAQQIDRRRLGLAQHQVGAGQQDRDDAGGGHGGDALFRRVFNVIRRQRPMTRGQSRPAAVRQLVRRL